MPTFDGYAIPVKYTQKLADHTFVLSSDGRVWPCGGRSDPNEDGAKHIIVNVQGHPAVAYCCSLPLPALKAGIKIVVTGVCHQISNRLLLTSLRNVWDAKGSRASYLLYGVYGRSFNDFFIRYAYCSAINLNPAAAPALASANALQGDDGSGGDRDGSFIKDIIKVFMSYLNKEGSEKLIDDPYANSDLIVDEFKVMVKHSLGESYDAAKVASLAQLRVSLFKNTEEFLKKVAAKNGDPKDLAGKINAELAKTLASMQESLGKEDFERLFGHPETDIEVVDSEMLAESFK
ncbi:hypothetical protein ACFL2A_05160 [Thermodesulfobacteriota bacterium]